MPGKRGGAPQLVEVLHRLPGFPAVARPAPDPAGHVSGDKAYRSRRITPEPPIPASHLDTGTYLRT